jgi:hypothetical protein
VFTLIYYTPYQRCRTILVCDEHLEEGITNRICNTCVMLWELFVTLLKNIYEELDVTTGEVGDTKLCFVRLTSGFLLMKNSQSEPTILCYPGKCL